jgi:hypothetical protein
VRYEPELKDNGMIARIGAIRKMNTSVEMTMVAIHAMRWLGVRREE